MPARMRTIERAKSDSPSAPASDSMWPASLSSARKWTTSSSTAASTWSISSFGGGLDMRVKPVFTSAIGAPALTALGWDARSSENELTRQLLAFARRQFNEAALAYNRAVSQFPTWVLSGLFGFRKAGTL